ncbi:MAG: GNAT family N-acetyltransferase [Planctomycetota bacterium]
MNSGWNQGPPPILETERLLLRPFALSDAPRVQLLAGDQAIADTTMNVPHPYDAGMAGKWIATHAGLFKAGKICELAICLRDGAEGGELVGALGLVIKPQLEQAEIGYWVGVPYQRRGLCTEAVRAALAFAFDHIQVHRVQAQYIVRNPASARVMEKAGMQFEGVRRGATPWHGVGQPPPGHSGFEDIGVYAMLRTDEASAGLPRALLS